MNDRLSIQLDVDLLYNIIVDRDNERFKVNLLATKRTKTKPNQPDFTISYNRNGKWYDVGAIWIKDNISTHEQGDSNKIVVNYHDLGGDNGQGQNV